jgi:hypothetical protein
MKGAIVQPKKPPVEVKGSGSFEDRAFFFPKSLVNDLTWAALPPAAASAYAVVGVHAHYQTHITYVSQERIARLAGYSRPSVSKGCKILSGKNLILVTRGPRSWKETDGRWAISTNKYYLRPFGGDWFPFRGELLEAGGEAGVWSRLMPSAQKLYVASRAIVYGEAWDQFWRDGEKRSGFYEWLDSGDCVCELEGYMDPFELRAVDYPVPPSCFYIRLTRKTSRRLRSVAGIKDKRTFDNALRDLAEHRLMVQFGYPWEEALLPIPYPSAWRG